MPLTGTITEEDLLKVVREAVRSDRPAAASQTPAPELNPTAMKDIAEALGEPKTIKVLQDLLDDGKITLPKVQKKVQTAEQKQDAPDGDPDAHMERNAISDAVRGLDNIAGQGIPWGSALVGGVTALTLSELIDGFQPPKNVDGSVNFFNVAIKGGSAWASVQFLSPLYGKTGAMFTAGFLVISILRDVLPLDQWIQNLVNTIRGFGGGFGGGNRFQFQQPLALNTGFGHQAQSFAAEQVIPGFGGAGTSPLDSVFSPN